MRFWMVFWKSSCFAGLTAPMNRMQPSPATKPLTGSSLPRSSESCLWIRPLTASHLHPCHSFGNRRLPAPWSGGTMSRAFHFCSQTHHNWSPWACQQKSPFLIGPPESTGCLPFYIILLLITQKVSLLDKPGKCGKLLSTSLSQLSQTLREPTPTLSSSPFPAGSPPHLSHCNMKNVRKHVSHYIE